MLPLLKLFLFATVFEVYATPKPEQKSHAVYKRILIDFLANDSAFRRVHLMLDGCWSQNQVRDIIRSLWNQSFFVRFEGVLIKEEERTLFVIDFDCKRTHNILLNTSRHTNFPNNWFAFSRTDIMENPYFPHIMLQLNTRFYYLHLFENRFILKCIYTVINSTQYQANTLGEFFINYTKLPLLNRLSDYRNRSNQFGFAFRMPFVWTNNNSLKHFEDFRDTQNDPSSKLCRFMIALLMELLNASYTPTNYNSWGTLANRSFRGRYGLRYNGMIGFIQDGADQQDISLAGTVAFMTEDRLRFLDFIAAPAATNAYFIFLAPPLSKVRNLLTLPFAPMLWLTTAGVLALFFCVLLIILLWENRCFGINENEYVLLRDKSDLMLLQIGVICQQGAEVQARSLSGRLVNVLLFFCMFFIYTAYSACIVALLQSHSQSIKTVADLYQSSMELGADSIPWTKFFFQNQKEPIRKAIYQKKIAPPNGEERYYSIDVGIEKIRSEFFAFHGESTVVYSKISRSYKEEEKCHIQHIEYLTSTFPHMCLKKNSRFKGIGKVGFAYFKEYGLEKRYQRRLFTAKPFCENAGRSSQSVSIDDCYFAVLIFWSGIFITCLVLAFEYLTAKYIKV